LDMIGVEYLSSIGIRAILTVHKLATKEGGALKIERPSQVVKNVLGMAALDGMLLKDTI